MLDHIAALHQKEYGSTPLTVASAPGVLSILGEQIEFAKSHSLAMGLQNRAWVALSKRADTTLKVFAANYQERKRSSISNLKFKKEDRFANLIKGILFGLENLGCAIHGLELTIWTDIPEFKSLGCSSAIAIAATLLLVRHFDFHLSDAQLIYLAYGADTSFQDREGSIAACFTAYFAHAGAILALDLKHGEHRNLRLTQGEFGFYLMDSMVPAPGAREELGARRRQFDTARTYLRQQGTTRELRDYELREAKDRIADLSEDSRRVCLFAIEEHHRLQLAEDTIEASNMPPLGKLLSKSHEGLRDLMELSCPELDWIVRHAQLLPGVLGARLTGKGLGGGALLFVRGELPESTKSFLDEYERIFGFKANLVRAVPSHRAQIHSPGAP